MQRLLETDDDDVEIPDDSAEKLLMDDFVVVSSFSLRTLIGFQQKWIVYFDVYSPFCLACHRPIRIFNDNNRPEIND